MSRLDISDERRDLLAIIDHLLLSGGPSRVNIISIRSVALQSIRQHIFAGPIAAKALAAQLKAAASKISDKLCTKIYNARKPGVTPNEMSEAMVPFLNEIEELREISDSMVIALDLVMILGEYSYGGMESGGSGYGERPFHPELDSPLVELATHRKEVEPFWNFSHVLETLQEQANHLNDYGLEDFFAQTISIFSVGQRDLSASERFTQPKGSDMEGSTVFSSLVRDSSDRNLSTSTNSDEDRCSIQRK